MTTWMVGVLVPTGLLGARGAPQVDQPAARRPQWAGQPMDAPALQARHRADVGRMQAQPPPE